MMSRRVDDSLGIKRMPKGYALMLDGDEMYFYWRCEDGRESAIHWNKWAVWRGAMEDARRMRGGEGEMNLARRGKARLGTAGLGLARLGKAGRGPAWQGRAWQGRARQGAVWPFQLERNMSKRSFFPNAIPCDETLARLNARFAPKPGDLITHEQMRAEIQPPDENRYRTVLVAWKRQLYRERRLRLSGQGRARGIGILVCTTHENIELGIHGLHQASRKLRREARGLDDIDSRGLPADEVERFNIARRLAHAMASDIARNLKEIPPPQPTQPDNVRLFKKAE